MKVSDRQDPTTLCEVRKPHYDEAKVAVVVRPELERKHSPRRHRSASTPFSPTVLSGLLRRLDAPSIREDEDWELLARLLGSVEAAKRCVSDAVDTVGPSGSKGASPPAERFREILRYEIARTPSSVGAAQLGITERQFFRERNQALRQLSIAIHRLIPIRCQIALQVADPLMIEMAIADAYETALQPRQAAEKLEMLLRMTPLAAARARIAARLAVASARLGNVERAYETLEIAFGAIPQNDHSSVVATIKAEVAIAELRVASAFDDAGKIANALARFGDPKGSNGVSRPKELLAEALADAGEYAAISGDWTGASRALANLEQALNRLDAVPAKLRALAHLLRAFVHSGSLSSLGLAQIEAVHAMDLATSYSHVRIAWMALFFLIDSLFLTSDKAQKAIALATVGQHANYLLGVAKAGGDAILTERARILAASAAWQLGKSAFALSILDDADPRVSPSNSVERLLVKAAIHLQLHHNAESLEYSVLAEQEAAMQGLVRSHGIADLYRSKALAAIGNKRSARELALIAIERLSYARDQYHLRAAYSHLYSLCGENRFQRQAEQLGKGFDAFTSPAIFSDAMPLVDAYERLGSNLNILTPRQRQILNLMGSGFTNRQIANTFGISTKTVDHHVSAVLSKLGLRARWQVASTLSRGVNRGQP